MVCVSHVYEADRGGPGASSCRDWSCGYCPERRHVYTLQIGALDGGGGGGHVACRLMSHVEFKEWLMSCH